MFELESTDNMNRNTQTRLFSTKRLCPVCHCQQAYLLHYIDYPNEYGRILPTRYRIVACPHCGMVYDDFDEGEEVFAKHYAVDGKYEMLESAGAGAIVLKMRDAGKKLLNVYLLFFSMIHQQLFWISGVVREDYSSG